MTRRRPKNRAQQSLRRPARERYATREISFDSDGTRCVGTLYRPARPSFPPVVVMAAGLGAERTFGYPAVAERFAEAGCAVFLFDYRHHGDSDGHPRRLVAPATQRADYAAAIDRVRELDGIDGRRLALWGHSLSGGHVLSLAGERADVDAALAIAPYTDGRIFLRRRAPRYLARATALGLRDRVGRFRDRFRGTINRLRRRDPDPPRRARQVPIVGDASRTAVIPEAGTKRAYLDLVDRESDWENATPARCLLDLVQYRPVERFDGIRAETFVFVPAGDRILPPERMSSDAERIDGATIVRSPADHFSVLGTDLDETVGYQLAFLERIWGTLR